MYTLESSRRHSTLFESILVFHLYLPCILEFALELSLIRDFQKKRYLLPFFPALFKRSVSLTFSRFCLNLKSWIMAPQSLKRYLPNELTDSSVNASSLPSYIKRSPTQKRLYRKRQLDVSPEFKNIPPKPAKVRRRSQKIRHSERSGDGADGRKMLFYQAHVLPQTTAHHGHFQESSQDVYPRRDLQVHSRLRSSPESGRMIVGAVRFGRPQLQRQICENGQDCVKAGQMKIPYQFRQHGQERVIPETPVENQVQTERCHQADQKERRRYNFLEPAGHKVLDDKRPLKPSNMNVSHPVTRYSIRIPVMQSQNYQPMVSQIANPAKSSVTGNFSCVAPQVQRNSMDFTEQEVVKNLGQPEYSRPTFTAKWKLKNAPSRPTLKDSRPQTSRLKAVSSAQLQKNLTNMEQYLERWATESNFMQEILRITETLLKNKDFQSRVSSRQITFNNGTSSQGESKFHNLPPTNPAGADVRSWPKPSSLPLSEYNPQYSPISP